MSNTDLDDEEFGRVFVASVRAYLSSADAYFVARAFIDYADRIAYLGTAYAGQEMTPEELARWALRLAKRVRAEGSVKAS